MKMTVGLAEHDGDVFVVVARDSLEAIKAVKDALPNIPTLTVTAAEVKVGRVYKNLKEIALHS